MKTCIHGHPLTPENSYRDKRNKPGTLGCRTCKQQLQFDYDVRKKKILPPDTLGDLNPYKEPLQEVDEGFGYKGTLKQSVGKTHIQCHICGYFFKSLGHHVRDHGINAKQYKDKFDLARGTSLMSDKARTARVAISLATTKKHKQTFLAGLAKGRKTMGDAPRHSKKKSLEAKNKQGRCYYQLLDKINNLAKKLEKVPTSDEFGKEYGYSYLRNVQRTFGTWNRGLTIAGFTPIAIRGQHFKYDEYMVGELFKEFMQIEGRPPRRADLKGGFLPDGAVIDRLFGGIIEARKYAGMEEFDYINETGKVEREVAER